MTDRAAILQKAVERHMPETNGISSGKNTEETYIIISNICLFWCLYETDLGICLIFLWTWNACDASDREYIDRMLYKWDLPVGRILHVLLLEEMDGKRWDRSRYTERKTGTDMDKNRKRYTAGRCAGMPIRQKKRTASAVLLSVKTKLFQLYRISNRKHIHIIF